MYERGKEGRERDDRVVFSGIKSSTEKSRVWMIQRFLVSSFGIEHVWPVDQRFVSTRDSKGRLVGEKKPGKKG